MARAQYLKTTVVSASTSSTAFVDVSGGSLVFTPASLTEVWVVLLSGRPKSTFNGAAEAAEVRYLLNGVPRGIGGVSNSAANSGAAWQHFYRVSGTTAPQMVKLQIRDIQAATTTLEDLRVIAFPVPAGADFQYAETNGIQNVAAGVWSSYQTLSFTPSSAGNYLADRAAGTSRTAVLRGIRCSIATRRGTVAAGGRFRREGPASRASG